MNNIQLAKSTNESLQFEKEKKMLMVIMPTAPFHTLISGSVSFPSFTPFTPIFPFSFMSCQVCANSGARRLHHHDDVIQTDSEGARSLARLKTGYSRFSSTLISSTPVSNPIHIFAALRSRTSF